MYDENSGALTELTFEPSENGAIATGISNSGVITGAEETPNVDLYPGFWTVTGGATLLMDQDGQPSSGTVAVAVNDNGDIVGNNESVNGGGPFLWSGPDHSMTTLPAPACNQCGEVIDTVNAINDSGTAVGNGSINMQGSPTGAGGVALEWQNGTVRSLGTLDGSYESAASGINDKGDVVGDSQIGPEHGSSFHAFLYHDGKMIDLGTLPGHSGSTANAINDSGEIVGASDSDAFLYVNGTMYNLNSLIDSSDPLIGSVQLQQADGINSSGWIAASGKDSRDGGMIRAFLLIPAH